MEPTLEEMARELTESGWSSWQQELTVWQSPDGSCMFSTLRAWQIMTKDRANKFDA